MCFLLNNDVFGITLKTCVMCHVSTISLEKMLTNLAYSFFYIIFAT